ncbi:MAG: hypothetical protein QOI55_2111, partial [Actinomycetota bacterium]|nr:hypothetical protein [Actinomycetota bacterium]
MAGLMTRAEPAGTNAALPVVATRKPREIRPPSLDTLFTVLFAAAGWSLGLRELGDNSFLWHWRTGRLILEHGIPHADPYSFTVPGSRWIAQSWLAELAYGIADRLAGGFGVRLLVALVGAAIVASSFRLALRLTGHRIRAAGLTFGALATVLTIWSERPLVFGLAGVLALVWAIEVPESRLGRHPLIAIPAIMWFWGNVHGSFSLGYVYLGLHLLGCFLDGSPPNAGRERKVLVGSVISVGTLLVNPYGFGLLWFPVDLMRRGSVLAGVSEWQSPSFRELGGVLFAAWLTVAVLALVRKQPSRRDLVITLVFAFLGLWAVRNVGVTALVTLPFAARAFAGGRIRGADRQRLGWAFSAAFAAFFVLQTTSAAAGHDFNLDRYPVKAMVQLQDRRL